MGLIDDIRGVFQGKLADPQPQSAPKQPGFWDSLFPSSSTTVMYRQPKHEFIHIPDDAPAKPLRNVFGGAAQAAEPQPTQSPMAHLPTQAPIGTPKPEHVNFLDSTVLPITRKQGIPDAVVAGQWAKEGGRLMDNQYHNLFGLKNHTGIIQYPNLEHNINDYALTVKNILKSKGYDVTQMKDPGQVLGALQDPKGSLYDAGPDNGEYASSVASTPEFNHYSTQ